MAWTVNAALRADGIVAQIAANLVAGGWTEFDASPYFVYRSTNNQGVTQYLQISQVGTYTYIQLQGWLSWNAGTHAGTSGSGTTYSRFYLGASPIAAAATVDLYMTVTANRVIITINSQSTNYRSWGYFGGLGTIAGTNDPNCVLLLTFYENADSATYGRILLPVGGGVTYWQPCLFASTWATVRTHNDKLAYPVAQAAQQVASDGGKILLFPIICYDLYLSSGIGPSALRGDLDGLLWCPSVGGTPGYLDTIVVGATTYLFIVPGGSPSATSMPWTGNYGYGVAIAEV